MDNGVWKSLKVVWSKPLGEGPSDPLPIFLALLNHFAIRRDYAIANCSIVHLHCRSSSNYHNHHKHFVQTLSPSKFTNQLASNFMWGILGRVSTVMAIMLIEPFVQFYFTFSAQFSNVFSPEVLGPIDFKFYMTHPRPGEGLYQS